jgi:hypothetical protein
MRRKDRELTDKAELLAILDEADVCRIAIQAGKAPYIVPLNFGYSWDERLVLYFHSATEGRKLELLRKNSEVGFELDTGHELVTADLACNWGMRYKSIIGTGEIQFIENDKEKALALAVIMRKYRQGSLAGYSSPVTNRVPAGPTEIAGAAEFPAANLRSVKVFRLLVAEVSGKQKK